MEKYFVTEKQVGETPLQALERLRGEKAIPKDISLAYAGRLDPMASGKLLILVGDECKNQEHYHAFDKEYVCEVLLGVGSDTHDVLGIIESAPCTKPDEKEIRNVLSSLEGTITLPYPHFSSKTVKGKPLHMWTLEGKLDSISIPTKTSTIYSVKLLNIKSVEAKTLHKNVLENVNSIPTVTDERKALGQDFRRTDVRAGWDTLTEKNPDTIYTLLTIKVVASSGTYMRTLASVIGEKLGTKALAYSIHRTKIGNYFGIVGLGGFFIRTY